MGWSPQTQSVAAKLRIEPDRGRDGNRAGHKGEIILFGPIDGMETSRRSWALTSSSAQKALRKILKDCVNLQIIGGGANREEIGNVCEFGEKAFKFSERR